MIISTPHVDPPGATAPARRTRRRGGAAAFTLAEVIVASALSSFLLAAILSTFLLIGRTGLGAAAYASMNGELRLALQRFNQDVLIASDVRWHDSRRLTLFFPAAPAVTYAYLPSADPAAPGRFVRQAEGATPQTLVSSVAPDFAFARYRLPDPTSDEPPAAKNDLETKQLAVSLRAVRPGPGRPSATQFATSARCGMRNKSVSQ